MSQIVINRPQRRAHWLTLVAALTLSLFFRLWRIDEYMSIDEHNWRSRSVNFYDAIADGNYAKTYQSEHPGVITMWVGVGGHLISEQLEHADVRSPLLRRTLYPLEHEQGTGLFPDVMWSRRIIALITWLGVIGVYLLGRRFLSPSTNLFTTVLLALDPFYLAFSRLHHLDGLLSCFMALSLWALLAYCRSGRRGHLLLSGAMAALATLNKAPGVFTVVAMVGVLGWYGWRDRPQRPDWLKGLLVDAALWTGVALAVGFALWPALWASPATVFENIYEGVLSQASHAHENGNYFFSTVVEDPGPLFYPVAWALRTTPFTIVGLIALFLGRRDKFGRRDAIVALISALFYGLIMTLSHKKFDRYLLPAFPLLCLPAGLGWNEILSWLQGICRRKGWQLAVIGGLALVTHAALLLPAAPYYTAYYNPLFGGVRVAPKVLLMGWGEGLEQAARYLNAKPNAESLHVSCMSMSEFTPFFVGHTTLSGAAPLVDPDYFVTYSSHVQRRFVPEVLEALEEAQPEFVAKAPNGLAYAWVYANQFYEQEIATVVDLVVAETDDSLLLLNASPAVLRRSEQPVDSIITERRDYLFTELDRFQGRHETIWFMSFAGLHDDSTSELTSALGEIATLDRIETYGDVTAMRYHMVGTPMTAVREVEMLAKLGEEIEFLGYDRHTESLGPGGELWLSFYWRATAPVDADYKVFVHFVDEAGQIVAQDDSVPQGYARPTTMWPVDQTIMDDHVIEVPPETAPGEYRVYVGMYELSSMQRLPIFDAEGERVQDDSLLIATVEVEP